MAKVIMIQGTASNTGKSLLTAGLCRIFMQDGYKVAPFKSQNMGLNSFITKNGFEMSRAQVMQAEACNAEPDVRMNPILLKPTGEHKSQVVLNGNSMGEMSAKDYFASKKSFIPAIMEAYNGLASENDIIVIEGAGSPAEINLKKDDIVNMGMARLAGAPVILAGDIDRGGVFAAIAGTLLLLEPDERRMVKGVIINKFRGDRSILKPGENMLEDIIEKPVLGVVPYLDIDVEDEDSLSINPANKAALQNGCVDIAVVRLPRIANFTDFYPFEYMPGVCIRYISKPSDFGNPDMVIIPGTKNIAADLVWYRESGIEASVLKYADNGGVIMGVGAGRDMLCKDFSVEGTTYRGTGLLADKGISADDAKYLNLSGCMPETGGVFSFLTSISYRGFSQERDNYFSCCGNIYGVGIHGFFANEGVACGIVSALAQKKGYVSYEAEKFDINGYKQKQYDILAEAMRRNIDMNAVYNIMHSGI